MEKQNVPTLIRPSWPEKSGHAMQGLALVLPALIAGLIMVTTDFKLGNIIFNSIADAYI